jgi:lipopolysaccharide export system permease protein
LVQMILFFYLVKELIFPFVLTTGILSSIMLMDQLYKFVPFMQVVGLDLKLLFLVMFYSLPTILAMAIPVSLMIGTYVCTHRLTADYEITSIRAGGISLLFLFRPVLLVSVCSAFLVLLLTFFIGPLSTMKTDELKFNALKKQVKVNLAKKKINNLFNKNVIYVFDRGRDDTLYGILISDWNQPDKNSIIEAEKGKIEFDVKQKTMHFNLKNGRIHLLKKEGQYQITEFEVLDYQIPLPSLKRENLPQRYRQHNTKLSKPLLGMTISELMMSLETKGIDPLTRREYVGELHIRIVVVLSCIGFAIFALPMGIFNPRDPKTGKFISIIIVLIIFYIIFAQAQTLLIEGKTDVLALYLPLLFVLIITAISYLKINYDLGSLMEIFKYSSIFTRYKKAIK